MMNWQESIHFMVMVQTWTQFIILKGLRQVWKQACLVGTLQTLEANLKFTKDSNQELPIVFQSRQTINNLNSNFLKSEQIKETKNLIQPKLIILGGRDLITVKNSIRLCLLMFASKLRKARKDTQVRILIEVYLFPQTKRTASRPGMQRTITQDEQPNLKANLKQSQISQDQINNHIIKERCQQVS